MAGSPAPPASSSGGGKPSSFGFLTKKIGGVLPVWVILAVAAGAWYWYYHYGPGAKPAAATQPQQGAGQTINVHIVDNDNGRRTGTGGTNPGGPEQPPPGTGTGGARAIVVERDMTLGELAASRHWTADTLGDVEQMNLTQGQGRWTPATQLHKGQVVLRPLGADDAGGTSSNAPMATTRWRAAA